MKKTTILILALLLTKGGFSQALVMDSSWLPNAGEQYKYIWSGVYRGGDTYTGSAICPKDTGANKVWDYSKYGVSPDFKYKIHYTNPGENGVNCVNPASNLVEGDTFGVYECYYKNADGISELSSKSKNSFTHQIENNTIYKIYGKQIKCGLNFRDEYRDTQKYITIYPSIGDSLSKSTKYNRIKYDGYGKLILGYKTYDTAIRFCNTIYVIDSLHDWNRYSIRKYTETEYRWYVPRVHNWVFSVYLRYDIDSISNNTIGANGFWSVADTVNTSTGVGNSPPQVWQIVKATIKSNRIELNSAVTEEKITYALTDATGRALQDGGVTINGLTNIPIKQVLPVGIYFLKITNTKGQQQTFKLNKN